MGEIMRGALGSPQEGLIRQGGREENGGTAKPCWDFPTRR